MNASLALVGTLTDESNAAVWSKTRVDNDTLTITPRNGSWTSGPDRTLTLNASDLAGNAVAPIHATYLVKLVFKNFDAASVVIGQADFAGISANQGGAAGANMLNNPYGNPLITADGKLFIGDYANNRILAYSNLPTASNASAEYVLGQPDFISASASGSVTQKSQRRPQQIVSAASKMIVAEYSVHRITIYNNIPSSGSAMADMVVGQPDFTSANSACSAAGLFHIESVAVTPGGKLIATDSANNRVLIWNAIPTAIGQPSDVVLSQADFTHCNKNDDNQDGIACATPSARTLNYPANIWTDGTRLVISDSDYNRVLIWNQIPSTSFQPADIVLGQTNFINFTKNDDNQDGVADASPGARTLSYPYNGIHSNGIQLAVADTANNRVLIWNTFPVTSFQPADVVLGQADFSGHVRNDDNQDGVDDGIGSARVLRFPTGVLFHKDRLIVNDATNNRFLIFQSR